MTSFEQIFENLAQAGKQEKGILKDGILHCPECGMPLQALVDLPWTGGKELLPIRCKCQQMEAALEEEKEKKRAFDAAMQRRLAKYNISDGKYTDYTFALDDSPASGASRACRRFVERWDELEKIGAGLLFYGSVGTGKSFYACCMVNALLEKGVSATVTSFPRLLNILQNAQDRQAVIDHLQEYKLLVIDDLGTERDSAYSAEQVFGVVDLRVRSGLPLIVTTNLTMEEMENPSSMTFKRIYDRVLEACPARIKMTGASRRTDIAGKRLELIRDIIGGD